MSPSSHKKTFEFYHIIEIALVVVIVVLLIAFIPKLTPAMSVKMSDNSGAVRNLPDYSIRLTAKNESFNYLVRDSKVSKRSEDFNLLLGDNTEDIYNRLGFSFSDADDAQRQYGAIVFYNKSFDNKHLAVLSLMHMDRFQLTVVYGSEKVKFESDKDFVNAFCQDGKLFVITFSQIFSVDLKTMECREYAKPYSSPYEENRAGDDYVQNISNFALGYDTMVSLYRGKDSSFILTQFLDTQTYSVTDIHGCALAMCRDNFNQKIKVYTTGCKSSDAFSDIDVYSFDYTKDGIADTPAEKTASIPLPENKKAYLCANRSYPNDTSYVSDGQRAAFVALSENRDAIITVGLDMKADEIYASQTVNLGEYLLNEVRFYN